MKKLLLNSILFLLSLIVNAQSTANRSENSEFFLEIKDARTYTVSVNDQVVVSAKGRFRFFELPSGKNILAITQNGKMVLKEDVSLLYSNRTMASYSKTSGFKIIKDIPLYANGRYRLDNWDKIVGEDNDSDYGSGGRPLPSRPRYVSKLSNDELARLRSSLKRATFDDEKFTLVKIALKNNMLYVDQLTQIIENFSIDDTKLDCALFAYDHIIDRDNFYLVRDYLTFLGNKEKLDEFLLDN